MGSTLPESTAAEWERPRVLLGVGRGGVELGFEGVEGAGEGRLFAQRRVVEGDFEEGVLAGGEVQRRQARRVHQAVAGLVVVDGDVALLQVGQVAEDGALGDAETAGDLADPPAALAGEEVDQFEDAEGTSDRQGGSFSWGSLFF